MTLPPGNVWRPSLIYKGLRRARCLFFASRQYQQVWRPSLIYKGLRLNVNLNNGIISVKYEDLPWSIRDWDGSPLINTGMFLALNESITYEDLPWSIRDWDLPPWVQSRQITLPLPVWRPSLIYKGLRRLGLFQGLFQGVFLRMKTFPDL